VSSTSEAFDGNAAALLPECLLSGESNSILLDNCGSTAGLRQRHLVATDLSVELACRTTDDQARQGRPSPAIQRGRQKAAALDLLHKPHMPECQFATLKTPA
jgi:hypothetical protein